MKIPQLRIRRDTATARVQTPRLTIIPLDLALLRLRVDDYAALSRALDVEPLPEPRYGDDEYDGAVRQILEQAVKHVEQRAGMYAWFTFWQIVVNQDRRIVGEFDFHGPPNPAGQVECGYAVRPEYRDKGYATEAVQAMTGWALRQRGVSSVIAETDIENLASQRVLEKAGAKRVGRRGERVRWRFIRNGSE